MRRFVVCLSVCHFGLVFSVLLVLQLPRLGKRELILVFSYVCSVCACLELSVSSSSLGLGGAAVCDCGTPWTLLLPFLSYLWSVGCVLFGMVCLIFLLLSFVGSDL